MTWLYLSIFIGLTLHTAIAKKDYFSPIRLYVIAYSFFLAINSLQLSRLQSPWSQSTNLLFWGSAFIIVTCGLMIYVLDAMQGGRDLEFKRFRESLLAESESLDWAWFRRVFFTCAFIYILSYGAATILFGTIPLLAHNPDSARVKFFGISMITNFGMFFGPLSMMLGVELLIFSKPTGAIRTRILALMGLVLALYFTIAMRLDLFRFGVFSVILYHYGRKRIGFKEFVIVSAVGVAVFVGIFLARVHSDAIGQLNEMVKVKMPKRYMWASQIYAYVVSNFWNMDYGFTRYEDGLSQYPMSWGFELFRPWFFFTQLEGRMQGMFGFDSIFNDSINYVKNMNSTVYVWHFWKDFGAAGVYGLSAASALALSIFYANLRRLPSLFRTAFWGICASTILFSVTAATWEFWFTYLNLIVLAIAHRKLRPA